MKPPWMIALCILSLSWQTQAFKDCDSRIPVNTDYTSSVIYRTQMDDQTLFVGGNNQDFTGNIDKDRVKQILVYCAPGIEDCMKINRVKKGIYDLTVSFILYPTPEGSKATSLKISSTSLTSLSAIQCFEKVWTSPIYPKADRQQSIQVTMPVQIR